MHGDADENYNGAASAEAVTPLKQGVNNNQFHDEDFSPEVDEMLVRSPESRYAGQPVATQPVKPLLLHNGSNF